MSAARTPHSLRTQRGPYRSRCGPLRFSEVRKRARATLSADSMLRRAPRWGPASRAPRPRVSGRAFLPASPCAPSPCAASQNCSSVSLAFQGGCGEDAQRKKSLLAIRQAPESFGTCPRSRRVVARLKDGRCGGRTQPSLDGWTAGQLRELEPWTDASQLAVGRQAVQLSSRPVLPVAPATKHAEQ